MKLKYVAILLSLSLLAGCGSANANTTAPSEPTATEQQSELVETETTQQEETNITEVATDVTTETVEKEVISDYIFDYEFLYNGKKVTLPMSYKEFSEITGLSIDEQELEGVDEELLMLDSMEIAWDLLLTNYNNPDAINDFGGFACFQNLAGERLHVTEASVCRVWFSIGGKKQVFFGDEDKEASFELIESWDEIEFSKGITWGSTVEEILEAYGEIEKCFVNEVGDGITRIFYRDPNVEAGDYKVLELYVHDEYGLTSFEYSNQKYPE